MKCQENYCDYATAVTMPAGGITPEVASQAGSTAIVAVDVDEGSTRLELIARDADGATVGRAHLDFIRVRALAALTGSGETLYARA